MHEHVEDQEEIEEPDDPQDEDVIAKFGKCHRPAKFSHAIDIGCWRRIGASFDFDI